jgi:hypothetical protein
VAGRLRALRAALHPDGLAQRRHVPDQRRPRRRFPRHAAVRAPQQLAGQRQPRQGSPAAVADQAEVRPADLVGRLADLRRQLRSRVDGFRDIRIRRRSRGRVGARGHRLGSREHLARRQALQRQSGAREPARGRSDGPHLRQPGRPERQPRSHRRGEGHTRDIPPHGHERRGDRGADRRRALVRQDPRSRPRDQCRPRTRGGSARSPGPGLEEQLRHRQGRRRHHQRHRGHLEHDADEVEQQLLRKPFRFRVQARQEPGRRSSMGRGGWRGHGSGCPRPQQAPRPHDADHGPVVAGRPGLREDLATLLRAPRRVRRRVRQGVVQADASRHGADHPLSRPAGSGRAADLAGSGSRRGSSADRRQGHRRPEGHDPRVRVVRLAAGLDRLGVGGIVPRHRPSRRGQRSADPPGPGEGLGGQRPGPAGEGARDAGEGPVGIQPCPDRRQESLARRPDRPGRVRCCRAGREEGRPRRRRCRSPRAHRRLAGADRRRILRGSRTAGRRLPQLRGGRSGRPGGEAAGRSGAIPDPDRARDDRPRRRHARTGRERRWCAKRRVHRSSRVAHERLLREPPGHGHGVEGDFGSRGSVRGPRSRHGQGEVDRHPRRSGLRVDSQLRAYAEVYGSSDAGRSSCATSWRPGTR